MFESFIYFPKSVNFTPKKCSEIIEGSTIVKMNKVGEYVSFSPQFNQTTKSTGLTLSF